MFLEKEYLLLDEDDLQEIEEKIDRDGTKKKIIAEEVADDQDEEDEEDDDEDEDDEEGEDEKKEDVPWDTDEEETE